MPTVSVVTVLGSYAKAIVVTADRIPIAGETLLGWDYRQTFGGKGSDMAVQAARLGADTRFLGVAGNDQLGDEFQSLLDAEQINSSGLRRTSERPTGVGLIIKDTQARNVIVIDNGANSLFSTDDIDINAEQFCAGGVAIGQLEIPLATVLYGLGLAKAAGMTTILNPAPAVDLAGVDLSNVDILTPNETEARVILGLAPMDAISNQRIAERLLAQGCGAVVITMGEKGVDVFTAQVRTKVEPIPIKVVDSNGAGDSFNAGLAVGIGEGKSLTEAARFANVVAGLCCANWETVPSYKSRDEVEQYIKDNSRN